MLKRKLFISFILFLIIIFFNFIGLNKSNASNCNVDYSISIPIYLKNKENLRLGFRTSAELFGKVRYQSGYNFDAEGFCIELGKKIGNEIGRNVVFHPIANDNAGDAFIRYEGLRDDLIDIECGPNTIFKPEEAEFTWQKNIIFSREFYNTGIKFLLPKEIFDKLNHDFLDEIYKIKIEVVENTTTYAVLRDNSIYHNYIHLNEDGNAANSIYDALQTLDNDKDRNLYVFASDLPILKTILKNAYFNKNYKIFPEKDYEYLPSIHNPEYYGIALNSKAKYKKRFDLTVDELKDTISNIIRDEVDNKNGDLHGYLDRSNANINYELDNSDKTYLPKTPVLNQQENNYIFKVVHYDYDFWQNDYFSELIVTVENELEVPRWLQIDSDLIQIDAIDSDGKELKIDGNDLIIGFTEDLSSNDLIPSATISKDDKLFIIVKFRTKIEDINSVTLVFYEKNENDFRVYFDLRV